MKINASNPLIFERSDDACVEDLPSATPLLLMAVKAEEVGPKKVVTSVYLVMASDEELGAIRPEINPSRINYV